jgi:alpha-glucosidase
MRHVVTFSRAMPLAIAFSLVLPGGVQNALGALTGTAVAVGEFEVQLDHAGTLSVLQGGQRRWQSLPGSNWVAGGHQALQMHENRGSFRWQENITAGCVMTGVPTLQQAGGAVSVRGMLAGDARCAGPWTMTFRQAMPGHLQFELSFANPSTNLAILKGASRRGERFYGFGEQFSHLDLKGHQVPVLSQEGGVGRGHPVLSPLIDTFSPGSAGDAYSTYYAAPVYMSSDYRSLFLENSEFSVFDLRPSNHLEIRLFSKQMRGRILAGESFPQLIERYTAWAGRMRPLPDWFNEGATIGVQGGTAKVNAILDELERRGTPIAGVWLQDWVGKRKTSLGSQLWWNWELDRQQYPGWDALVDRVESRGGRMLCYINAFLVDASPKGNVARNLYQEALAGGYLVKREDGSPYRVKNTDFDAGMIDFTNPEANRWIKDVIRTQMIEEGRCGGWMHDFGEALPFDAVLADGRPAAEYHNEYPVDWIRIGREAIEESGHGHDVVMFNRAGYSRTPQWATLLWQGDQLVTWDAWDGFQSAVTATLSGGFSGISLNHSDIGGYTNASLGQLGYNREEELLLRWMEFSAFTAAFRTHEGLRPEANAQAYSNSRTFDQFDRFARVYKSLAFYRRQLMQEAAMTGMPLVRHPMLHYPQDTVIPGLRDHLMLGDEILMAPIINKSAHNNGWKKVYFPDADSTTWINPFTGQTFGRHGNTPNPAWLQALNPATGHWRWVYAPIGKPAAFYRQGSLVGEEWQRRLRQLGVQEVGVIPGG